MEFDREFPFELFVCRYLERNWPLVGSLGDKQSLLVGRQLGTQARRWDTIVVVTTEASVRQRARFGPQAFNQDLLRVLRNAPATFEWYRDTMPQPGFPWRYVRAAVRRAADRDLIETRHRGGRLEYRRRWTFPDWPDRIIVFENKPDLGAAAADDLAGQLQHDVALGLADETWVCTRPTGDSVEPIILESIPVEAGIITVDPDRDTGTVEWYPRQLDVDGPGEQIDHRSTEDATTVSRAWKQTRRLELAERVYGRGWRSYVESMRPDCRHFSLEEHATGYLPWCSAKQRCQTQRECAGSCSAFEPEPPQSRMKEWPLDGGSGRWFSEVLQRRRRRRRPGEETD